MFEDPRGLNPDALRSLARLIIRAMPGRTTQFLPECFYHIYNRGNNRGLIFFEQDNYLYFLQAMKKYVLPAADIMAYCLMPNHYHLMIRAGAAPQTAEIHPVSIGMMKLAVSYTKAINKRFGRVGVLFQGRFQAKPITNSAHLLQLCRYIHANPVKDGLVKNPGEWPFSNYLEWAEKRDGKLVDHEFVRGQFPEPGSYTDFVEDYVKNRCLPEDVQRNLEGMEV